LHQPSLKPPGQQINKQVNAYGAEPQGIAPKDGYALKARLNPRRVSHQRSGDNAKKSRIFLLEGHALVMLFSRASALTFSFFQNTYGFAIGFPDVSPLAPEATLFSSS